ncbi:lasso peptide biosynthesis B2 protein [Hazenella sp. IB182357]|uniref:Lasso peptide biosynthesis B2 protein n=1 Tax=Polycladospora coralii TaxID=2771432 RepID=A0A926RV51_9BACL|nr:lasso peptide biosynthesis B2 protein [Polycladospora coralii]MBD1373412.1 lasso peptide biosynthesis B2 protein [Polycladospora coralii]
MTKIFIFFQSYWYLFSYYRKLRKKGFPMVLKQIKIDSILKNKRKYIYEKKLIRSFTLACKYHFYNIECLERSLALYSLLNQYGYRVQFQVGVKQKPFLSHAWIETEIKELDESDLRNRFKVFIQINKENSK